MLAVKDTLLVMLASIKFQEYGTFFTESLKFRFN